MRRYSRQLFERAGQTAVALSIVTGLVLASGAHRAVAADQPDPPELKVVEVVPPAGIRYEWAPTGAVPIDGLRLNVYQGSRFVYAFNLPDTSQQPGAARTGQRPDIFKPGSRYCAGLLAYVGTGQNDSSTFSEESERRCFVMPAGEATAEAPNPAPPPPAPPPPPPPTKPDVAVSRLTGPMEVFDGTTALYEVAIWNDGTPVKDTALVQVNVAGALELVEVVEATNGLTCETNEFGLGCTGSLGGVDDAVQTRGAVIRVQVRATGTGVAVVLASANHFRAFEEMSENNNVQQLTVTVK